MNIISQRKKFFKILKSKFVWFRKKHISIFYKLGTNALFATVVTTSLLVCHKC